MTNPKRKLVVVPEGWVVVPRETAPEMNKALYLAACNAYLPSDIWLEGIKAAPSLPDTPPVLRWVTTDGLHELVCGDFWMATILIDEGVRWFIRDRATKTAFSVPEARRAAEKALGFPDGLVVDVIE